METTHKKIDELSEKIDSLANTVGLLSQKTDTLGNTVTLLSEKTDTLGNTVTLLSEKTDTLGNTLESLANIVESLANHSMQEFSSIREEMGDLNLGLRKTELNLLDKLASTRRVDELEARVHVLESKIV